MSKKERIKEVEGLQTKTCYKCKVEQSVENFGMCQDNKDNLQRWCKSCHKKYSTEWYCKNKKKVDEQNSKWQRKNKIRRNLTNKKWRQENKNKILQYRATQKRNQSYREWQLKYNREYVKQPKVREKTNAYRKLKMKENIQFKLSVLLRARLCRAVKKGYKAGSAVRDLGCSIPELKMRLERMFYSHPRTGEKMTWDNWELKGWHIDHIIPLASFDLTDRGDFLEACHWTNLQPMWAEENIRKGDSIMDQYRGDINGRYN